MPSRPPLLRALGERVRALRTERSFSLQELAERADLSRRFLVEIEAGRANPSLLRLARLAEAFRIPLCELCTLAPAAHRSRRLALLGLRGAGKSTLGPQLATALEVPFHELTREIETAAGMSTAEIFELEGQLGYLSREAEALEGWLRRNGSGVLALPGGFVRHTEAYERLRKTCRTVWLQATPTEHWDRVVAQGDTRPMRGIDQAMTHLRGLLEQREPLYAKAEITLSTSNATVEQCLAALLEQLRS